jgi:hypothetical protein
MEIAVQLIPSKNNPPVIVDALPYIDNEYEEVGMKEMVII